MEARGVGTGWLCVAVLCSGAALVLKDGHQSTTQGDEVQEPTGAPTASTGDVEQLTTWPTATPTPPWTGDPVTTPVPTQAGAVGNKTQTASALPIRYWSPAIFVVVALVVLFFTYRWNKGEGTQDQATSSSDSSDLGALDHLPTHDTTLIIPAPQERKGAEPPPAPQHTETTFCELDPPPPQLLPPQPDTPPATSGPLCSGEPGAD